MITIKLDNVRLKIWWAVRLFFLFRQMDLKQCIEIHDKSGTLEHFVAGFQKSQFVENNPEITNLVKSILTKLISDSDKQKIYNQLQSGGIANHSPSKNDICKKQSFCTEFNMMIMNLVGLIGFEFSKYLLVLFGSKLFINRIINEINDCITYEHIETCIRCLHNLLLLGTENIELPNPITLSESFVLSNYLDINIKVNDDEETLDYYSATNPANHLDEVMTSLMKYIHVRIKSENIISFNQDRNAFVDLLNDLSNKLTLNIYQINSVNDLIINLGNFNVCYDKSFIKMFEILYNESFADIPHEFWNDYKPHVIYIEKELNVDVKCSKYLDIFNKYYRKIFDDTYKCALEVLCDNLLKINVTDSMYELMSDITLNLLLCLCRKISNNQLVYSYFGKSTRIQFIQIFQSVMDCAPRLHMFSPSQRAIIHYILLSDKIILDSVKSVNEIHEKANVDKEIDN